jgi:predicted SAM-dependent methyltransferase
MRTGSDMKMLNIGCGATSHSDWVNIDLGVGNVICHDVTEGLPFPGKMFDVVYHSHLLEHIPLEKALPFMAECSRVLKPGGIVRVLVPDLEQIARLYLEKLSTAKEFEADYDWIMLELYDQCIRENSGGLMEHYLHSTFAGESPFVAARMGTSVAQYGGQAKVEPATIKPARVSFARVIYRLRLEIAQWIIYAISGRKSRDAFMEGLFRNSGEVHRWMYDRFSLGRLMSNAGFTEIQIVSPVESRIPDFARYKLDSADGVVRKPDSLVMEGVKP